MYIELSFLNSKVLTMDLYFFLYKGKRKKGLSKELHDTQYDKYLIRDMIHFFFY